ncbi:MAG: hypothetical protein ACREQJ_02325 [Candidatus Binatia bacterium]
MRLIVCIFALLAAAAPLAAQEGPSFGDSFDAPGTLPEAPAPESSASADWWLNSGALLLRPGGTASTILGKLPKGDPWRAFYAATNPVDTDDGKRPQNVFRLLTRRAWRSFKQTVSFRVHATNDSASANRNASNGVLLFLRYLGGSDFYYAGLRVDGAAVIKRKRGGQYETLDYRPVYPGLYERTLSPNLLPPGRWIGLKATVSDRDDGSVKIKLKVKDPAFGDGWVTVGQAVDAGGAAIRAPGFAGLRTDFMDVELDEFAAVPKSG